MACCPAAAVHPRVRGDHAVVDDVGEVGEGPPPRTRGPHAQDRGACQGYRSTPAYAGTTPIGPPTSIALRVHPRVRGDHLLEDRRPAADPGPPPRTRGPRDKGWIGPGGTKVHPRVRGDQLAHEAAMSCRQVHPRVRGDHYVLRGRSGAIVGPPPRTRGPRLRSQRDQERARSTPAYAGTTLRMSTTAETITVHPRVRGDHGIGTARTPFRIGPPPRTRGPPAKRDAAQTLTGSTPAYAGTTRVPACRTGLV